MSTSAPIPFIDSLAESLICDYPQIPQATGMLSVQLDGSLVAAESRLRSYAIEEHRPLAQVADDVVARRLWLSPSTGWHERRPGDGTPDRI